MRSILLARGWAVRCSLFSPLALQSVGERSLCSPASLVSTPRCALLSSASHVLWTAHRCCSSLSHAHGTSSSSPHSTPVPASSAEHASPTPEELLHAVRQVGHLQNCLKQRYTDLLLDRRVLYRDHLLRESLTSLQDSLHRTFRSLLLQAEIAGHEASSSSSASAAALTHTTLRQLKAAWLAAHGAQATPPSDPTARAKHFQLVRAFYSGLLCSGLMASAAEVRAALDELQETDLLEPDASFYEAVFISLWSLDDVGHSAAASSAASPSVELVAGEAKQLQRSLVGDLASHYMGHALAQLKPSAANSSEASSAASATVRHIAVRRETWEVFFCTFANAQPAPKLMDLWWKSFVEWVDASPDDAAAATEEQLTDAAEHATTAAAPLPYQAVHAVLAWCAQARDMERALRYFSLVNQRGVTLHAGTTAVLPPTPLSQGFRHPGSLTAPSSNDTVQQLQLALLVKLMASTKSVKMDGGLRALVVRDVQRQISADVLFAAPWGVLNDLLAGLSVRSAMQLLRCCSSAGSADNGNTEKRKNEEAHPHTSAATSNTDSGRVKEAKRRARRDVPFFIWASLLRRCCHEHLQDHAESLFLFIRTSFPLTAAEKRELVEIMMRMYVTLQPADFPTALDVFLQHVLRTPPGEPAVKPDGVLYELLIKGADSRNAAMMLFLEACANGVQLTEGLFEALMGSTQFRTVSALSRKLPHDYANSSLDAQLKIPADADAHLRREEALRARGKPLYDSTGDADDECGPEAVDGHVVRKG